MKTRVTLFLTAVLIILGFMGCEWRDNTDDQSSGKTVKVFKFDGSVQCEGDGIPLDEMEQELTDAGVTVLCSQESNDGMARIALCGHPTGNINVYLIYSRDYSLANRLGFEKVEVLGEYVDQPCDLND